MDATHRALGAVHELARESSPTDRRAWIVRLTPQGQRGFEAMAQEHEQWILELFAGLNARGPSSNCTNSWVRCACTWS